MSKILEVRRKLESVANIGRVTNAMQLVSASRFHQSYKKTRASRPYAQRLQQMMRQVDQRMWQETDHVFFRENTKRSHVDGMIVLGTEKGLCGSLNHRLLKQVLGELQGSNRQFYWTYGSKINSIMQSLGIEVLGHSAKTKTDGEFFSLLFTVIEQYKQGLIDRVLVAYNHYDSVMVQRPRILQLLPLAMDEWLEGNAEQPAERAKDYLVEPSWKALVDFLLTQWVRVQFYQAALESDASEQAARMVSMKTATDNASRLEDRLQLQYNNVRQAMITSEIIEIVSGSEAV